MQYRNVQIRDSGKPLSESDLDALEQRTGITLPEEYSNFLLACNGGEPIPGTPDTFDYEGPFQAGSVREFIEVDETSRFALENAIIERHRTLLSNLIPLAEDPYGNLICLSISGDDFGKVYFWMQDFAADPDDPPDYRNVFPIANSFNEFLDNLYYEPYIPKPETWFSRLMAKIFGPQKPYVVKNNFDPGSSEPRPKDSTK